ncbi:hypothetical protein GIB67_014779 [Kingdonia uniflora]|uniref:Trichome birefringence-like C-terminal domain-containing protein n=1 Tax=Kingdonia uniflora TaxID=39325 RepID=A0A7J7NVE3_9MAGN|nr:hypothetical protein GIB67_014779 [Kingdonia uniflora]
MSMNGMMLKSYQNNLLVNTREMENGKEIVHILRRWKKAPLYKLQLRDRLGVKVTRGKGIQSRKYACPPFTLNAYMLKQQGSMGCHTFEVWVPPTPFIGDQVHPHLDVSTAFRRALATWALWVDRHVTLNKTQVFFRSSAPSHFKGGQWNSGGHCREGIRPLNNASNTNQPEKYLIAEEVIKQMKTRVTFLNITSLSEFRIDGHPSIYGKIPAKETPSRAQDCSHWCLPGVPDTWNELLYFYLQSKQKKKFHGLR